MTTNHFRSSIEYIFGDRTDIKGKRHLANLMRKRGFFNADIPTVRERQSQRLLNDAWTYLSISETVRERVYSSLTDNDLLIRPKSFKKFQIRDKKTGRIKKWV